MCQHDSGVVCHIIPPHMLDAMSQSADAKVRDAAIANIVAAERARAARATLAELRPSIARAMALETPTKKRRVVYDAKKKPNLNGTLVREEGDPNTGDKEVDEAYRYSGYVHGFYKSLFGRNSIDDAGMLLKSSVRYREDPQVAYNNAFWSQQQMAYGDGDGVVFKRFTASLDIVGHELSHGVVEFTANLAYRDEPGALNESYADVFGSLIKQWHKKQTADEADWLIGDDVLIQADTRKALRSMQAPGTAYRNDPFIGSDPQPAHMDDKYKGTRDYGGVHINSGIPNRAFYLVATELGGQAWERAGLIWYRALLRLKRLSDFEDCAQVTYMEAGITFGQGSVEQQAVKRAWEQVGLAI